MKSTRRIFIAILATMALSVSIAFAGGSVSFEEAALPLLRTQPHLLRFIQQSLDVAPVGEGVRLGLNEGEQAGKRITPFQFEARPKGTNGPYTLILMIHSPEGMNITNSDTVSIEIRPLQKKP